MFSKRQLWGLLIPLIIEQLLNSLDVYKRQPIRHIQDRLE